MMCEVCGDSIESSRRAQRRKLWEINVRVHCSVVGTCLTLSDLRRVARHQNLPLSGDATDFQIHSLAAIWAAKAGPAAKQMQKILDRRYATAIRRFAAAADAEETKALWDRCLSDGDVPGPYWALLTHPATTSDLTLGAFGEVHMLSHLVGASNRADLRRLQALEKERDALNDALAQSKRRIADQEADVARLMEQHAGELREVACSLGKARAGEARLRQIEDRLRSFEQGEEYVSLRVRCDEVSSVLADTERQLEAKTRLVDVLVRETAELRQANDRTREFLCAASAECEAMEVILREHLAAGASAAGCDRAEVDCRLDLCGRRIVYVGGRGGVIPHLRALVERCNGTFLHHDGGLEEQSRRLDGILVQGDAVFCAIDCVSHDACQRAKRLCRQWAKAFVPLRSGGLSSFVIALRELATVELPLPSACEEMSGRGGEI